MTVAIEFKPVSLSDRIKNAKSNDELLSLATEGFGYEYATNKTRNKWRKAMNVRNKELSRHEKEPESKPASKKSTHKKEK